MSEQRENPQQETQKEVQEPTSEPVKTPETAPETAPQTPPAPEKTEKAPISEKKRTALLRYMAVLFGVAFLLVLLSFLIQIRDSRETISDLNKSNASALQNAVQLQEQNQALNNTNDELEAQLEEQEQAMEDLEAQLADAEEAARLSGESAEEEKNLRQNYEFLFTASQMFDEGDYENCYGLLTEEMDPSLMETCNPVVKAFYDDLLARCQEQLDAAEPAAEE